MCGWAKAEHSTDSIAAGGEKAKAIAANKTTKRVDSAELRNRFVQKTKAECQNFVVDMNAANFGTCTCGLARADHTAEALAAGDKAKANKQVDSEKLRSRFVQKTKAECQNFVVDMNAANFGTCTCGMARADHTAEALAASDKSKANARVDSEELRKQFVQKERCACTKYVVNMNSAAFGECMCGAPKADHTPEALAAGDKARANTIVDSEALRQKFVTAETIECEAYEIDMVTVGVPFGQCVCGHPKSKHSEVSSTTALDHPATVADQMLSPRAIMAQCSFAKRARLRLLAPRRCMGGGYDDLVVCSRHFPSESGLCFRDLCFTGGDQRHCAMKATDPLRSMR